MKIHRNLGKRNHIIEVEMILSDKDLRSLIKENILKITPFAPEQIGPTSIDLRLGSTLVKYDKTGQPIVLGKTVSTSYEIEIDASTGYTLAPNEFVLAATLERVCIPNGYQGFIETKGDIARAGLQVHNADGHVDPGSDHVITLEIKNNNEVPVIIFPHIFICQIFLHTLTSMCERPYSGKYLGQTKPTIYIPK